MNLSLIDGWFVPVLTVVTLVVLALAVGWRTPRWRRVVGLVAVASVLITWVLYVWVTTTALVQPALPVLCWSWPLLVVFSILMAVAGWHSGRLRHRLLAVPAVALSVLLAAALFNSYFAYYPTLASVFGKSARHEMALADAQRLRAHVHARAPRVGEPGGGLRAFTVTDARPAATAVHGVTVTVDIPGRLSGFSARSARVYLPPAWFSPSRPVLPVVLLLAGTPGTTSDWLRAGMADRFADRFAATHGGRAPIIVMADENGSFSGDTECVDGPHGQAESYLTLDVRQFVIDHFYAPTSPRMWAVAGDSEGGTCALTIALRHPDLFGTFGDFGGDLAPNLGGPHQTLTGLFRGSPAVAASYQPTTILAARRYPSLAGWFEAGGGDGRRLAASERLAGLANRAGIRTVVASMPGRHTFRVWRASFAAWLPWAWQRFGVDSPAAAGSRPVPTVLVKG